MHVKCFTMHYCSKDFWIFHRNNCSAHTDDWHTYTQAEQRCSQRARKSRLKPLRVAAHKQRYFSCLWLPLTCCLGVAVFDCDDSVCEVGSCFELGRLIGSLWFLIPWTIVACCHIKESLIVDDHSLSAHTLPTPVSNHSHWNLWSHFGSWVCNCLLFRLNLSCC